MGPFRSYRAALVVGVLALSSCGGSSRSERSADTGATTATAPAGPAAQPAPSNERFGASVNRLFDGSIAEPQLLGAQLAALRATGASVARSDAPWETAEPSPPAGGNHRYRWSLDDTIASALAEHRLRWMPIIDYSPAWAYLHPGQYHSPPRASSDYAAYARAFATRYGPSGTFWSAHPELPRLPVDTYEIWNEPDNPAFWAPSTDPGRYADLYLSARDAITSVDPAARVVVGGLTNVGAFLPVMLHARPDLRGHFDGVGMHPYAPDPAGVLDHIRDARILLRSLGLHTVPLYVTEFGWTTRPRGAMNWLPERRRPAYISRTIAQLGHPHCGVAATFLYTWVTPERNPRDREDWYGIEPPAGGGSPDTAAFASAVQAAERPGGSRGSCG